MKSKNKNSNIQKHQNRAKSKKKSRAASLFNLKRFTITASIAALASFQIANHILNPGWDLSQLPHLSQLWLDHISPHTTAAAPEKNRQGTGFSQCPQFFPNGIPPTASQAQLQRELCFSAFAILHSGETKTPVFVVERLNRNLLEQGKGLKRSDKFYADARLPRSERAELEDYKHSGYSRGHMAPAANMYSPEAMAQSFSLANMVPQNQQHNAGAWNKIEQDTRRYVSRAKGDVFIYTGPVFDKSRGTIGPGKVSVPSHLFKLIYDASTGRSWAYWHSNQAQAQSMAPINYEELRRRTGLELLAPVIGN